MIAKLVERFPATVMPAGRHFCIERDGISDKAVELVGEWDYDLVALADGSVVKVNTTRPRFRRVTTDGKFVEEGTVALDNVFDRWGNNVEISKMEQARREGRLTDKFVLYAVDTWKFEKGWNKKNHV